MAGEEDIGLPRCASWRDCWGETLLGVSIWETSAVVETYEVFNSLSDCC